MKVMKEASNHKAERQLEKRLARVGLRAERQRNQRRQGPNVRIRECKQSGSPFMGYSYTRLRDGKTV